MHMEDYVDSLQGKGTTFWMSVWSESNIHNYSVFSLQNFFSM